MRRLFALPLFALAFAGLASTTAVANDGVPFLSVDPIVVSGTGVMTVQQWFSLAHGSTGQSFSAFESQTELDVGLTDRLDLALTLLYDWSRERPPGGPAFTESKPGFAAELLYQVLPLDQSPIGLALAVDPAFNADSRAVSFRVLLEKQIFGLQNVLNINFDNDWEKDGTGGWQGTSGIAFNYGIAYAADEHWTLALEIGNELAFDDLLTSGRLRADSNTIFFGPTVQYDCELAAITLSVQTQLPISSGRGVVDGYTADAERWRVGLRLTRGIYSPG